MIYIAVLCNPKITAEPLYNTPLFTGPYAAANNTALLAWRPLQGTKLYCLVNSPCQPLRVKVVVHSRHRRHYMWSPQRSLPVHRMQSCWSLFSVCIIIRVGRAICTNNDWLVHQWIFQFHVLCKVFIFCWVSACAWLSGSAGVSSTRADEVLQDGWPRESDCRPLWEWHRTYRPRRG